jgi:hypothetical protein
VTANPELILDGAMDGQESSRPTGRLEAAHVTFTLPSRLV